MLSPFFGRVFNLKIFMPFYSENIALDPSRVEDAIVMHHYLKMTTAL